MKFVPFRASDSSGWRRLRETRLFDHRYIQIDEVELQTPHHQRPVSWTVARRKPGVVVAPRLEDGRFLLIQQDRYPIQRTLWEFPAGQIDEKAIEDPDVIERTALRELREETGHALAPGGEILSLGYFFVSQGFTDEHAYLFLATAVRPTGEGLQLDEFENILDCRPFSVDEIRARIAQNEIVDGNTLALFARLCARGLIG